MSESSMISPNICTRCAAGGRTCCSIEPGSEEFCFPLSEADMARIAASVGDATSCFVHAPNTAAFADQLATLLPKYEIRTAFPPDGHHWRLATTDQGHCVFLGVHGCVLDRSIRPMYCRLFPLWSYHGRLTWFTAEECLANKECTSLAAMLTAMHTDDTEVHALFDAMCSAMGLTLQHNSSI
jgi:Fe-S-cluster containining protein